MGCLENVKGRSDKENSGWKVWFYVHRFFRMLRALTQLSLVMPPLSVIELSIGSGNGLLPDGTKPLPEPICISCLFLTGGEILYGWLFSTLLSHRAYWWTILDHHRWGFQYGLVTNICYRRWGYGLVVTSHSHGMHLIIHALFSKAV